MDEWRDRLADVDDDYLIGISNKGIVKRAYKDREETAAEIAGMTDDEVVVKVGGETVTVRFPLGESKCSCPSRSICRHVVQGILALKESCLQAGAETAQAAGENSSDMPRQEQSAAAAQGTAEGQSATGKENPDNEPEDAAAHKAAVLEEIEAYPFDKLKKAIGSKHFQSLINQVAADIRPGIQHTSVVTVQLQEPGITVKLLSPLAYSTCTCHKKELCRHKAAAILWCQLEAGTVTRQRILSEAVETADYDLEEVREAAGQMKEFLSELFSTGLSRVSPDVLDYLERLAIISHNAQLPRFEGYFRALSDSYDRYLKRKAAFQTKELIEQLSRLYCRVEQLRLAKDAAGVARLAGEFRADYLPVGNLDLIGIAMEHFQSQTGYEGETIYFLEENTGKWYTYTNARPVFYDSSRRKGYGQKSQAIQAPAPWGLNISLENLLKVRIRLTGAKCDERNRLSSSQETKGEITGERGLSVSDIKEWYYRDFGKLFREQVRVQQREWLDEATRADGWQGGAENGSAQSGEPGGNGRNQDAGGGPALVFVRPDSCAKSEFSRTGQQLTLPLYDRAGHELLVEVTYSKEESATIRYLERISQDRLPCFLGKIYLKEGRIRMYPVDLPKIEEPFPETESEQPETMGLQGNSEDSGNPGHPGGQSTEMILGDIDGQSLTEAPDGMSKYTVMEDMIDEVFSLLEDLCQSGFATVHDSTWKDLRKNAELVEQYGMKYLSELLGGLAQEIEAGRHRMEKDTTAMEALYVKLVEYTYLCSQKAAYDRGGDYYL